MVLTENKADGVTRQRIDGLHGHLKYRVYQSLKDSILTLNLAPGDILRKSVLCKQLGVSRSPVSEAIALLAAEGLVEVIPQSGTYVSRFSMEEIREGAFLREALELAAVEKVAAERSDEQLTQLTRNLRFQSLLVEDQDFAGFHRADEEMHALIMSFTGFKRIGHLVESAWLQVNRARRLLLPTPGRVQETVEEHKAIVDAIRDRDPAAARIATQRHLGQLIKRLEPLERERPDLFQLP
jgi:DNA-binding GntR family transcriptional regulator